VTTSPPTAVRAPRVSIVMPTFNVAPFVGEAIEGLLAQTMADFELIVIDDGSTDGTAERVEAFADPRIRLVRAEHAGLVAAENRGLALAAGEYVCRADGDDLYLPHLLEREVELLDARPEVVAVGVWDRYFGGRQGYYRTPTDARELRRILRHSNTMSPPVMYRAEAARAVGGYRAVVYEDWDLWIRLAARHDLSNVPECLALRRVLPESYSRSLAGLRRARARLQARVAAARELGVDARSLVALARSLGEVALYSLAGPLLPEPPSRPQPASAPPPVAVVVLARSGDGAVPRCLAALERQLPPPADVVVLDGDDPLPAIAGTTAEVVAVVTDDQLPQPGWIAELGRAFLDPTIGAAAGPVRGAASPRIGSLRRRGPVARNRDGERYGDVELVRGGALAFRRELVEAAADGRDWDARICLTARRRGMRVLFSPWAVVEQAA
jgi:hypothetical protein